MIYDIFVIIPDYFHFHFIPLLYLILFVHLSIYFMPVNASAFSCGKYNRQMYAVCN